MKPTQKKEFFLESCYATAIILGMSAFSVAYADETKVERPISFYNILVGNTLIGSSSEGNNSTEYHAPDGRVLGYNWDTEENIKSCWRVVSKNTVCYYYAYPEGSENQRTLSRESCWKYKLLDPKTIFGVSTKSQVTLKVTIEQGNSRNLTDFGVNWSCDVLSVSAQDYVKP